MELLSSESGRILHHWRRDNSSLLPAALPPPCWLLCTGFPAPALLRRGGRGSPGELGAVWPGRHCGGVRAAARREAPSGACGSNRGIEWIPGMTTFPPPCRLLLKPCSEGRQSRAAFWGGCRRRLGRRARPLRPTHRNGILLPARQNTPCVFASQLLVRGWKELEPAR